MPNNSLVVASPREVITPPGQHPNFLEGNSNAITLQDLQSKCIVTTWANNELTISHQLFIKAVSAAAHTVFGNDMVKAPEIRVLHAVNGRTPDALHKRPADLLDSEKTLYYQRMCFCIAISVVDSINGNETNLVVGGVRALNNENLGSRPSF